MTTTTILHWMGMTRPEARNEAKVLNCSLRRSLLFQRHERERERGPPPLEKDESARDEGTGLGNSGFENPSRPAQFARSCRQLASSMAKEAPLHGL